MIWTIVAVLWWSSMLVLLGPIGLAITLITGDITWLWARAMFVARTGVRLAGMKVKVVGRERLDPKRAYIYMSNHVSNLDPPTLVPEMPHRTSIMPKKELFSLPILGRAMRIANFVPVDRKNREAAIQSVQQAVNVVNSGLSMLVYPEGTRSETGQLLPFKKGPFHLAMTSGAEVVPVTMVGTAKAWPKHSMAMHPGELTVVFHEPIDPKQFASREELMAVVRERIASVL